MSPARRSIRRQLNCKAARVTERLQRLVAAHLGSLVSAITVDAIRSFMRKRQQEKTGSAAINRSLALLRRMFNIARIDDKIQFMPVIRLLKEPPLRKGFVIRAQFEHLLWKLPAHLRLLVTFLYYCGVRVGEAIQIEWSQVDLQGALIRLEREQTKTSAAHRAVARCSDLFAQACKEEIRQ
jgi:integrase